MTLSVGLANAILGGLHPNSGSATLGSVVVTAPVKMRLMTVNGNTTSAGTELASGNSYVAGTGISIGSNWAAASGSSQSTNNTVSQANMPAATIVGVEFWDSSGTPQRLEWQSITSKTTVSGDTLTFTAGAITSAFS